MTAAKKRPCRAPFDRDAAAQRRVLNKLAKMSQKELFALAVEAGIYTKTGKLTKPSRSDGPPSPSRPTD